MEQVGVVEHEGRRPDEAARRLGYRHETNNGNAMAAGPTHASRSGGLPELVVEVDIAVEVKVEAAIQVVYDVDHGGRKPTPQVDARGCR